MGRTASFLNSSDDLAFVFNSSDDWQSSDESKKIIMHNTLSVPAGISPNHRNKTRSNRLF